MSSLVIRPAVVEDLAVVVGLLVDDALGSGREVPAADLAPYLAAFRQVEANPYALLVVGELDGAVVATAQLMLLHGLSRGGALRLQVEGVRVASSCRGAGLGGQLMTWAHHYARDRGAVLAQLTSDKRRTDAHRFYEKLGYVASHEGLKLSLD